jgi:hypothetical protein
MMMCGSGGTLIARTIGVGADRGHTMMMGGAGPGGGDGVGGGGMKRGPHPSGGRTQRDRRGGDGDGGRSLPASAVTGKGPATVLTLVLVLLPSSGSSIMIVIDMRAQKATFSLFDSGSIYLESGACSEEKVYWYTFRAVYSSITYIQFQFAEDKVVARRPRFFPSRRLF